MNLLKRAVSRIANCKTRSRRKSAAIGQTEALELRALLSGVVKVTLTSGGDLNIVGDSKDNFVEFVSNSAGFSVVGYGTTIEGFSGSSSQFTGNIKIALKGGNDHFISNSRAPRDVAATLGGGDDIFFWESPIGGDLSVSGGSGHEEMYFGVGTNVNGDAKLTGGSGNDEFAFQSTIFAGTTQVLGGGGADEFSSYSGGFADLSAKMGGGNDSFFFAAGYATNLNANLGGGHDTFEANQYVTFSDEIIVALGSGNDSLLMNHHSYFDLPAKYRFDGGGGFDIIDRSPTFYPTSQKFEQFI